MTGSSARRRARLIASFVLVSIAAHVLCLRVLPAAPRPRQAAGSETVTLTIESQPRPETPQAVELMHEPGSASHSSAAPNASNRVRPEAPAWELPAHADTPVPARTDIPEQAVTVANSAAPTQPATTTPAPAVAAPTAAPTLELDPRRIALSTLPASAATPSGIETPDARAARRSAELSAELRAVANAAPLRAHRTPDLVRDPDGTCHYAGSAIAATILPDGGVRFDDRPPEVKTTSLKLYDRDGLAPGSGVPMPPARPTTAEDQIAGQRLEYRAVLRGRASDAEREWFLRETAGVRRELADAAHARELAGDEHALRKRLDQIWCDPKRPAEERRRAIFGLWNDTSPDEMGRSGRRVVLDYIRENLPRESALAFPTEQLAALNAQRQQREAFEPYAARPSSPAR